MRNKSLKFQVVTTFVLFLTIAMLSVSCLWVMFLQRTMVAYEAEKLKLVVDGMSAMLGHGDMAADKDVIENVALFLRNHNMSCYQLRYRNERIRSGADEWCLAETTLENDEREARTDRDGISYSGSIWSVFTYSNKVVAIKQALSLAGQHKAGEIAIQVSLLPLYEELRQYAQVVFYYGIANILILAAIGFIRMMILVIRPIDNLIARSEGYSPDADLLFTPSSSNNEFTQLSSSLNQMVRRIHSDNKKLQELVAALQLSNKRLEENKKEMVRAEKLASIGKLSAGLAHEIGNPLGIIQGYVDMLGNTELSMAERRQFASRADAELRRISQLIRQLLDFSRSGNAAKQSVNVGSVLNRVVELVSVQKMSKGISIEKDIDLVGLEVQGEENQLQQVFLNCILNSVEAATTNPDITLPEIHVACHPDVHEQLGDCVKVAIVDNGPGLSEEQLRHAFDPFFTTKEPGRGTGLGLYVSYTMVEGLGGSISIQNNDKGGGRVEIYLPIQLKT